MSRVRLLGTHPDVRTPAAVLGGLVVGAVQVLTPVRTPKAQLPGGTRSSRSAAA
ncbi:hypothetical protein ACGF5S_29210 [Nocardia nova]|uniref:hypothetical protein n=1 Tax=Nocardia nova TaxID=37330 RepID=UPI00371145AB